MSQARSRDRGDEPQTAPREWRRFNDARDDAQIPGGEALDAVGRRIRDGLEQLCDRRPRSDVVVVNALAAMVDRIYAWQPTMSADLPADARLQPLETP